MDRRRRATPPSPPRAASCSPSSTATICGRRRASPRCRRCSSREPDAVLVWADSRPFGDGARRSDADDQRAALRHCDVSAAHRSLRRVHVDGDGATPGRRRRRRLRRRCTAARTSICGCAWRCAAGSSTRARSSAAAACIRPASRPRRRRCCVRRSTCAGGSSPRRRSTTTRARRRRRGSAAARPSWRSPKGSGCSPTATPLGRGRRWRSPQSRCPA